MGLRHTGFAVVLIVMAPGLVVAQSHTARTYVQRIVFVGTNRIDDRVLRSQLLQFEGAYLNTTALEQSRARIERLPYVEKAEVTLEPVVNATDQVNVVITITDAPARKYGVGGGYSQSQRASVNGYFVNENLFGRGQRFSARLETSDIRTSFDVAHTDPFAHNNGLTRSLSLAYRDIDQLTVDASELDTEVVAGRLDYSFQTSERQSIRAGLSLQNVELVTGSTTSGQLVDWTFENGHSSISGGFPVTDYLVAELALGWHFDTRKGRVFPDSGHEQRVSIRTAIPGGDIQYFTVEYSLGKYWPLPNGWTARAGVELGYGAAFGSDTTALPPNLNWFAGGPGTVRGFREHSLGPKDSLNNPYGGNLLASTRLELIAPLPEKWRDRLQLALFYDAGNVFSTEGIEFPDDDGSPLDFGFDLSEMRQSVGVSAKILLPMGILGLSYGVPLNADENNPNRFLRDDIENFQLSIGVEF